MRLLFIGLEIYSKSGGIARYTQQLMRALAEINTSNTAISLWDSPSHSTQAPSQIKLIGCEKSKAKALIAFFKNIFKKPQIILYGHILLAPFALIGKLCLPHARHYLFVYGIDVWAEERKIPQWEKWIVRHCLNGIITISRFTQKKMEKAYKLHNLPFYLLHPNVDLQPTSMLEGKKETSNTILTVTRLSKRDRYKGVDKVILALPKIISSISDANYLVVGEGDLKSELQELAQNIGIKEKVHFLGFVDDQELEKAYHISDVFVMPSSKEGFGIVFLEAWQHKLPVICGNQDASPEVVTNNVNGFTVNPDSMEELVDAIVKLLKDKTTARQMAEEGYNTIAKRYSYPVFQEQLIKILEQH